MIKAQAAGAWVVLFAAAAWAGPAGPEGPPVAPHADAIRAAHERIKNLKAACEQDPKAWAPRIELAETYLRYGLTSRAVQPVSEAIALRPDHAPAYHLAGSVYFDLRRYDEAVAMWEKALDVAPADRRPAAWIIQARKQRDSDARLAELDARLKATPTDVDVLVARARLRAERGEWREVLTDADLALSLRPEAAEALALAAEAHEALGRLDQAVSLWRRASEAQPASQAYRARLDRAVAAQGAMVELARLHKALQANPADGALQQQAGELSMRLGHWTSAAQHLAAAVQLRPKAPAPRKSHAIVLFRLGRMEEAIREAETGRQLDPNDPAYDALLANIRQVKAMHEALKGRGADESSPAPDDRPRGEP